MLLNQKIQAYLLQNSIVHTAEDYQTGQPEGGSNQVLHWNVEKLGPQPTQGQLDVAFESYVPAIVAPTKEQLMAELAALTSKIQALE